MAAPQSPHKQTPQVSRRGVLKAAGWLGFLGAWFGSSRTAAQVVAEADPAGINDAIGDFFQQHYQKMSPEEVREALERIGRKAKRKYRVDITVGNEPPIPGVVFGYALNISKCKGTRRCV